MFWLTGISQMWKCAKETLDSHKSQSWPRFSNTLPNTTLLMVTT